MWFRQDSTRIRGRSSRSKDDRHWPVVEELDLHTGAEHASSHPYAFGLESVAEHLVERLCPVRRSSVGEARAVAFRRVVELSDVNWRMESR
jgi:hypothetical protein